MDIVLIGPEEPNEKLKELLLKAGCNKVIVDPMHSAPSISGLEEFSGMSEYVKVLNRKERRLKRKNARKNRYRKRR